MADFWNMAVKKHAHTHREIRPEMMSDSPSLRDFPGESQPLYCLVGGLEHEFYDFPYVGNNTPN